MTTDAPSTTRRPRRALGALLLAIAFAAGALAGAAADLVARPTGAAASHRLGVRVAAGPVPQVLDDLGLTAEQRRRVETVLERGRPRTEAAVRETLMRLRAVSDSLDQEVRQLLTPEQRARLDAMRRSPAIVLRQKVVTPYDTTTRAETLYTEPALKRPD